MAFIQPTSSLVAFPDRRVIGVDEASRHLGITPGLLRLMGMLRCGVSGIGAQRSLRYRIEDLDACRVGLLRDIGLDPDHCRLIPTPGSMTGDDAHPLMCLLVRRRIMGRAVLMALWAALAIGLSMTLVLF